MVAATTSAYLIPVGEQDRARLNALGAIYNEASLDFVGDLPEGGAFLDIGCGNGTLTRLFAEKYPKTTVVGADISPAQIEVAGSAPSSISWEVCDVYHLSGLKAKYPKLFDVVFCRFILSHVPDIKGALDQMYTMVKPGGSLFIIELGAEHHLRHHPKPLKAIQAWQKMVELQFQLQKSHKDTVQRVLVNARKMDETLCVQTKEQDFEINDLKKKLLFSLGMEAGISKLQEMGKSEIIQHWGYPTADAWRQDMDQFLNSDQSVTMRKHEWIHIKTRTEAQIAALKQAADQSKDINNSIDGNLIPFSISNGIMINPQTEASKAASDKTASD